MDQAALVKSDRDVGAQVMEALGRARIPVTLVDWTYVPELDEWQLVIATPWYETRGPRAAFRTVVDALQEAGIYARAPLRRMFVRSPEDPIVKVLMKERKEGLLHLLKHGANQYSAIFAPVTGTGGAVPVRHFSGVDELRSFLAEDLHLTSNAIAEAMAEVQRTQAGSIYPVEMTAREMKRLGLA